MSVLIKGMKMPENCIRCPFAENVPPGRTRCLITRRMLADGYNAPSPERNDHCPLVALPDTHGDLIDRDEAYDCIAEQEGGNYVDMDTVGKGLECTPTIVEAEERES